MPQLPNSDESDRRARRWPHLVISLPPRASAAVHATRPTMDLNEAPSHEGEPDSDYAVGAQMDTARYQRRKAYPRHRSADETFARSPVK